MRPVEFGQEGDLDMHVSPLQGRTGKELAVR